MRFRNENRGCDHAGTVFHSDPEPGYYQAFGKCPKCGSELGCQLIELLNHSQFGGLTKLVPFNVRRVGSERGPYELACEDGSRVEGKR